MPTLGIAASIMGDLILVSLTLRLKFTIKIILGSGKCSGLSFGIRTRKDRNVANPIIVWIAAFISLMGTDVVLKHRSHLKPHAPAALLWGGSG
jgi:hypothetical protein